MPFHFQSRKPAKSVFLIENFRVAGESRSERSASSFELCLSAALVGNLSALLESTAECKRRLKEVEDGRH